MSARAKYEVLDVRFFRFDSDDDRSMVLTSILTVGAEVRPVEALTDLCDTAFRALGSTTGDWRFVERSLMERTMPLRDFVGRDGPIWNRVHEIMRRIPALPPPSEGTPR